MFEENYLKRTPEEQKWLDDKLITAVKKGMVKDVIRLLANGANSNARDDDGRSAVSWCADLWKSRTIPADMDEELFERQSKKFAEDRNLIFRMLYDMKAELDLPDHLGKAPLHHIAEDGLIEAAGVFILYGANARARDIVLRRPAKLAEDKGFTALSEFLKFAEINQEELQDYSLEAQEEKKDRQEYLDASLRRAVLKCDPNKIVHFMDQGANIKNALRPTYESVTEAQAVGRDITADILIKAMRMDRLLGSSSTRTKDGAYILNMGGISFGTPKGVVRSVAPRDSFLSRLKDVPQNPPENLRG